MTASKRKYHDEPRWDDVLEALRHYELETGCAIRVLLKPSTVLAGAIILTVVFDDLSLGPDAPPAWEYREPWTPRLKPNLEPIMMRVLHDAFAAMHSQPWSWTAKMRRMARSE